MAFGAYRSFSSRSGDGINLTALAANDLADPFNLLMYCSSAFFCANVATVPTTAALWNGLAQTESGSAGTGIFTCSCSPAPNPPDPGIVALGGGPLTIITPVAGSLTGDFWNITYSGANSHILTIDYNVAAGTAKSGALAFFVFVMHSRRAQSPSNQMEALDGGRQGTSLATY